MSKARPVSLVGPAFVRGQHQPYAAGGSAAARHPRVWVGASVSDVERSTLRRAVQGGSGVRSRPPGNRLQGHTCRLTTSSPSSSETAT
jgi:hypothetical protein